MKFLTKLYFKDFKNLSYLKQCFRPCSILFDLTVAVIYETVLKDDQKF